MLGVFQVKYIRLSRVCWRLLSLNTVDIAFLNCLHTLLSFIHPFSFLSISIVHEIQQLRLTSSDS